MIMVSIDIKIILIGKQIIHSKDKCLFKKYGYTTLERIYMIHTFHELVILNENLQSLICMEWYEMTQLAGILPGSIF